MSLGSVWVSTQADGLVRADQIVGIDAHQTPALSGKPAHWLLDVVLPTSIGSGRGEGWNLNVLHRTLLQTPDHPGEAPVALARLLAQLDVTSAAGIVTTSREPAGDIGAAPVRFRFVPFASPAPGRDTGSEYL